ncbi:Protein CPNA-4 [Aphelenchoides avenae]|nr:Protein CPNA-4 [Aphelenchus avenae]
MYRVNEEEDGREPRTLLYRSETVKHAARLSWRAFSLQSTEISGRPLEVISYYRDNKTPKGLVGQFTTDYQSLLRGTSSDNNFTLTYENSRNQTKSCGTFEVVRCTEMAVPSFLEFISSGAVINYALAIDFSRPDGTVEEPVIRRYVEDVDLTIRAFGEPMRYFNNSNSYAAFGFGAKVPPQFRESQEFCLNLDTDPYCRGIEGVQSAFKNAFTSVQPINTAHLSHVIYYVSKLAQNAFNRSQAGSPCYYVLIVITRGVFDDIKETVQAVIFASRAPISIIFVGIGEADLTELQRLGTAGMRLNYHGRKPERDCIQYVSVPKCREEETEINDLKALISERGLLNIPHQMSMFMTKNGIRPSPGNYQQEPSENLGYSSPPPVTPSALSRLESAVGDSCADIERLTF